MAIPHRIPIALDDYHARLVGKLRDGRQLFSTNPFVPESEGQARREFFACYVFDAGGAFLAATIDEVGSDGMEDRDAIKARVRQRLADLGPLKRQDIEVAPFTVEHDGIVFGLVPSTGDDDDGSWVEVMPGNYMAFSEPWDGSYDT